MKRNNQFLVVTLWQRSSCQKVSSTEYLSDGLEKDPEGKLENKAIISGQNWQTIHFIFSSSFFIYFVLFLTYLFCYCWVLRGGFNLQFFEGDWGFVYLLFGLRVFVLGFFVLVKFFCFGFFSPSFLSFLCFQFYDQVSSLNFAGINVIFLSPQSLSSN